MISVDPVMMHLLSRCQRIICSLHTIPLFLPDHLLFLQVRVTQWKLHFYPAKCLMDIMKKSVRNLPYTLSFYVRYFPDISILFRLLHHIFQRIEAATDDIFPIAEKHSTDVSPRR